VLKAKKKKKQRIPSEWSTAIIKPVFRGGRVIAKIIEALEF
jgi:hypothetical protein